MRTTVKKRRRGQTTVSSKNQVTLPVDALARAGLATGDRLDVEVRGPGELVLRRVDDALERFAGALTGVYRRGELDDLRDEWR
ncbi:MAG TPA: AbrB/MazE/SpoVT family DNA-binding domain-containing protein [Patescibacteria group bacterium]|nr:AbrB/MazE/SpoVT family DNA-binding domain-containing protein [Patescibacteria group bacterium]